MICSQEVLDILLIKLLQMKSLTQKLYKSQRKNQLYLFFLTVHHNAVYEMNVPKALNKLLQAFFLHLREECYCSSLLESNFKILA